MKITYFRSLILQIMKFPMRMCNTDQNDCSYSAIALYVTDIANYVYVKINKNLKIKKGSKDHNKK